MSRNYQRHSKGGRFKKHDIGDAGIRSYSEQQQNLIDSIKLEKKQNQEITRDQLTAFDRSTNSKVRNLRELADLESKIYQGKVGNIKTAQARTVEALEAKAKEYGEKRDFYTDFSTTYAQQWGDAYEEIIEFKDRVWADSYQGLFFDQFPNIIKFEEDQLKEDAHLLLEESLRKNQRDNIAKYSKVPEDETDEARKIREEKLKEARQESKTIIGVMSRTNKYLDEIKVQHIKDNIDQIEINLKRTILSSENLKWNQSTVLGHYEQAAKNIIVKAKIRPNSKEARDLHALFRGKANAAFHTQVNSDEVSKDAESISGLVQAVKSSDAEKRKQKIFELSQAVGSATRKTSNGKFVEGITDHREKFLATAQELAPFFDNQDEFVTMMTEEYLVEDQKGNQVGWSERYTKQLPKDSQDIRNLWTATHDDNLKNKKKDKAIQEEKEIEAVKAIVSSEDFDITDPETIEDLREESKKYKSQGAKELVSELLLFDFDNKNKSYLDKQITDAWKSGQSEEFNELMNLVNKKTRDRFSLLIDDMRALNQGGGSIRNYATNAVRKAAEIATINVPKAKLLDKQINAYEDVFYRRFHELKHITNSSQRYIEAQKYADEQLANTESGIFRRGTGEDNELKWWTWEDEPNEGEAYKNSDDLYKHVTDLSAKESTSSATQIESIVNAHTAGKKTVLKQDDVDLMLLKVEEGRTITIPEEVDILFTNQYGPKEEWKYKTRRELFAALTGVEIPKGHEEYEKYVVKNSNLNVPDKEKYNKNEQAAITMLQAMYLSDIPEDAIIKWPFSKSLDDLLNYASSLGREVEEDDIDLSRYYGVTGKTASEIRDYTYFRYKKDEGVEIGATKKGRFGHTLEYGVISGSNTQKHLGWKLKDGLF